ncbi:MAG TPA: oxidoreductase, partial [Actinopolymorphaceae bacterium]
MTGTDVRVRRRHLWLGAVAGWIAALAGLVCAQVVAAFGFTIATPLVVVGGVFIDHVPTWLKEFATKTFGTNDKLVLALGMGLAVLVLSGIVGVLSVRRRGFAWLALAIAAIGAWAASTRNDFAPADLIPSVVAGVVAALVLHWLAGRAADAVTRL